MLVGVLYAYGNGNITLYPKRKHLHSLTEQPLMLSVEIYITFVLEYFFRKNV